MSNVNYTAGKSIFAETWLKIYMTEEIEGINLYVAVGDKNLFDAISNPFSAKFNSFGCTTDSLKTKDKEKNDEADYLGMPTQR